MMLNFKGPAYPPKQKQCRAHGYILHIHHHFTLPGKPSVLFFKGNFTPKTSNYIALNIYGTWLCQVR